MSIQSFPAVLISRNLGYREAAVFEGDETLPESVKASLS